MADTDTDPAAIELQRRQLLAGQPPEPTSAQETSADSGIPRNQPKSLQPKKDLSTNLSFSPVPELKQYDMPTPQPDQFTNPFEVFKDPMIVLAGLSSLLTRRPLTAAMNYAASAMKGYHQGQQDVFEQNKVKFDEALTAATNQNRVELARYNDAWKRRDEFNWQKVAPNLYAQASANNDQIMMTAIKSGNWELVEKILVGRETAQNGYQKAFDAQEAKDEARRAEIDRWKKDPGVQSRAQAVVNLEAPYPTARSMNNFRDIAVQEAVEDLSQGKAGKPFDQGAYGRRTNVANSISKGTGQGARVISLNTSIRHFETMEKLIDELNNGNFVHFNQWRQSIAEERGKPEVTNYDLAAGIVAKEVVKSLVAAGGGVTERQEIENQFSRGHSPEQLHGLIQTGRELLGGQFRSLQDWARANDAEDLFDKNINDATRRALDMSTGVTGPVAGTVEAGYRFKGGDPGDQNNWEKVK